MNELGELLKQMQDGQAFNWFARGNGYGIRLDDYRRLLMEVLYAIENSFDYLEYMQSVMENVPDYWEELADEARGNEEEEY